MTEVSGQVTPWVPVIAEAGWYPIGDPADQSPVRRWPHDRWISPFAIRDGGRLAVTAGDVARLMVADRYGRAVGRTADGMGPPARRSVNELSAALTAYLPDRNADPFPLTFGEARLVAMLLGGRIPLEEEVEIMAARFPVTTLPAPLWTASPWSAWSYRLSAYDSDSGRWQALRGRSLPDAGDPSGRVAIFIAGPPLTRTCSRPPDGGAGQDDGMHPGAEGERIDPRLGLLWLVTSL